MTSDKSVRFNEDPAVYVSPAPQRIRLKASPGPSGRESKVTVGGVGRGLMLSRLNPRHRHDTLQLRDVRRDTTGASATCQREKNEPWGARASLPVTLSMSAITQVNSCRGKGAYCEQGRAGKLGSGTRETVPEAGRAG